MSAPERIPPQPGVTVDEALERGELTIHGRIADASNAVLYATAELSGRRVPCVYKPVAGERPLWDFPDGTLAQREVAAYEVSRALGWDVVPPTVLRDDPLGGGMCQLWVGPVPDDDESDDADADEADEAVTGGPESLLGLIEAERPEPGWKAVGRAEVDAGRSALLVHVDDERLRRIATLDAVINNGDRKGGHLLPLADGRLYGIDHGVTFHTEDKLRTLLWGWAGEPLPAAVLTALRGLDAELADGRPLFTRLLTLITEAECRALRARTAALLSSGRHPLPGGEWPAIPWPLI
ncbi:SCO1664 family protein [Streptomyces hainanensis]|uniref:SCO1664 family protein n=1 Tax=Streptomyces hainanensis TaxID=402648 RepID=A0A4R4TPW2_9ACTN|nr:SCO1664 family protein [Streptomyces hainanensis]TDC77984.1 SCO1664 family protein [Streptomyces hainanensis]